MLRISPLPLIQQRGTWKKNREIRTTPITVVLREHPSHASTAMKAEPMFTWASGCGITLSQRIWIERGVVGNICCVRTCPDSIIFNIAYGVGSTRKTPCYPPRWNTCVEHQSSRDTVEPTEQDSIRLPFSLLVVLLSRAGCRHSLKVKPSRGFGTDPGDSPPSAWRHRNCSPLIPSWRRSNYYAVVRPPRLCPAHCVSGPFLWATFGALATIAKRTS